MSRPAPCSAFLLFAATWAFSAHSVADSSSATPVKLGAPPPGYHDIKTSGGTVVRVADQGSPHFHGSESTDDGDKYDPQNANFGRTSSFANKTFDTSQSALSQNDTAQEARDNKQFLTPQPYSTRSYNQADRAFQTVAYNDAAHPDAELNKSFALPTTPYDANQSFNLGQKSDLQGKTALIAQAKVDPFSAPGALTEKTFYDPSLTKVKRDPYAAINGLDVSRLTKLPNRALTIDEVRNLINHEQVPDLNSKPDESSRPLNDPNWTPPDAAPPVLDDRPVKPGPTTEDKSDELPSPGMIAQPQATPSR